MGDGVDPIVEANKNDAISDVGDPSRIPALGHTFLQIVVAVGGGHTAGVHPDGQVF